MHASRKGRGTYSIKVLATLLLALLALSWAQALMAQDKDVTKRLKGFDAYMAKVLKDWNVPGIGVGIVVGDKPRLHQGVRLQGPGKRLPFTPNTLYQIASNSKLFTAVAAGLLVDEGKLTWDKPVRESVPAIQFYDDKLNDNITLRDMLSHRTGITRHDMIWYQATDTRQQLFDKVKYLEPQRAHADHVHLQQHDGHFRGLHDRAPERQDVGGVCPGSASSSPRHEPFPLLRHRDDQAARLRRWVHGEARQLRALQDPLLRGHGGHGPRGAIISNIEDMSHWLIAHERRPIRRETGPAARRAEGDLEPGHSPAQPHG